MSFDEKKNLAKSIVATAPTPPASGPVLSLTAGTGTIFGPGPFNALAWPPGVEATLANAEILRVGEVVGDTMNDLVRGRGGTSAKEIEDGWQFAMVPTAETWEQIQSAIEAETVRAEAEEATLAGEIATAGGEAVKLTGNQTIEGVKTFESSPIIPMPAAKDSSNKAADTAFVQTAVGEEATLRKEAVTAAEAAAATGANAAETNAINAAAAKANTAQGNAEMAAAADVATETTRAKKGEKEAQEKAEAASDKAGAAAAAEAAANTALALKAPLASPTLTGTPIAPTAAKGTNTTQIASTAFVQSAAAEAISGLTAHANVVYATAAALPANTYLSGVLTGTALAALTVDGEAVTVGQRILVKNEVLEANNGLYVVTHAGGVAEKYVLTRAADMASTSAEVEKAYTFVEGGKTLKNSGWFVATPGPFTIGTTAIPWGRLPGSGDLVPGEGITIDGNVVAVASSVDSSSNRDNFVNAVKDYGADPSGATFSTTALKEAWEAAKAKKWALLIPLGVYKVSTVAGTIFVQGEGEATPIIGLGCGTEGTSLTRSATSIVRAEGTLPIWTCIGTEGEVSKRGHPVAKDIEFNGLNTVGDLVVFARVNDVCFDNVRVNNAKGRLLRVQQSFNGMWGKCYFTNGGSPPTRFTGCSWGSGQTKVTVKGIVPSNVDNLLCYGHGITYGTVVKEAKELKAEEWEVILSAATTEASTATGAFTIEGAPALSIEGYPGLGGIGSSAVNHLTGCEFEGNAAVDIDLAGSADGQSSPASLTTIVNGKQERQVATNHEPVIRERYAFGTVISAFPMNPGGNVTTATGTIAGGELNKIKLAAKNALIAAGQQVTGLGSPKFANLKANGVTTSKTLQIQGRVPLTGAGSVSEGTTFSGVTTGMRVRSPGSTAITPGTTVLAVTATTIELSAEPTEEMAGVDIVVGGMFVESIANEETVTLDTNALNAHAAQSYIFGGSRTKHVSKPSYGFGAGELILNAIRMAHSGAPDIYIDQASGKISEGSMVFTSDGAIPPGMAYHRLDSALSAEAFKLPTRGANAQYPLQLINDERVSTEKGLSAAYVIRKAPIGLFVVGVTPTVPVLPRNMPAYSFAEASQTTIAAGSNGVKAPFGGTLEVESTAGWAAEGGWFMVQEELVHYTKVTGKKVEGCSGGGEITLATGNPVYYVSGMAFSDFLVPDDIALGAWLYVRPSWWSTATTEKTSWRLDAYVVDPSSTGNLATVPYERQEILAGAPASTEGHGVSTVLKTKATINGQALLPGALLRLALSRVAGASEMKAAAMLESLDVYYQRA
jgi:hypothetical protein